MEVAPYWDARSETIRFIGKQNGERRYGYKGKLHYRERCRVAEVIEQESIPHPFSGLKDLRRVWKLKTSRRQLSQYLIHHTGDPAAAW